MVKGDREKDSLQVLIDESKNPKTTAFLLLGALREFTTLPDRDIKQMEESYTKLIAQITEKQIFTPRDWQRLEPVLQEIEENLGI